MFYRFVKVHGWPFTQQNIQVYASSYPAAREQAKRIAGSGFALFLVAVEV